jgi:hypothetical protein
MKPGTWGYILRDYYRRKAAREQAAIEEAAKRDIERLKNARNRRKQHE